MFVSGAPARPAADPGVTQTTILLGATAPLPSAEGAVARGAAAYFKHVNARGGVHGRTIVYRVLADGGNAAQATRRLVEEHGVFALVGSVGTEQNLAARDYLNAAGVPQLFAASGATSLGELRRYPWTIGFQPSHRTEGWIYGRYLARAAPDATVAVLFEDDDYGRELLAGLREGIARSRVKVVATQRYDAAATTVQPQVARLKASGATVLALFAATRAVTQAQAAAATLRLAARCRGGCGGRPPGAGGGGLDLARLPQGARRPALARRPRNAALPCAHGPVRGRFGRGQRVARVRNGRRLRDREAPAFGRREPDAGGRPRAAVAANDPSNPFLLPGIAVRTSATERFPIEQAQLRRFTGGRWRAFGGLWSYAPGRR